jgi:hypothetical protein
VPATLDRQRSPGHPSQTAMSLPLGITAPLQACGEPPA